jgi:hypothetical protein
MTPVLVNDTPVVGPDPLRVVWEALEARGCDPHGAEHDFRARCPAHDGENRGALHVAEGADRRAVLYCFRGCRAEAVVRALGLGWGDLFRPGHHRYRRRPQARPGPRGRVEVVLEGLELVGIPVRGMWIADRCPYCDAPGLWIRSTPEGLIDAECVNGCAHEEILGALETIVAIREATDGAR